MNVIWASVRMPFICLLVLTISEGGHLDRECRMGVCQNALHSPPCIDCHPFLSFQVSYFFNPISITDTALIFLPDHFALGQSPLFSLQVSYFFNPIPVTDSALSLLLDHFVCRQSPLFSSQVSYFFNPIPIADSALSLLPDHCTCERSPLFFSQVSNHPNHYPPFPHFSIRW